MVGGDEEEEEQGVTGGIHHDWLEIDRIIAKDRAGRYLVKWRGLGYSDATWERSLMGSDKVQSLNSVMQLAISTDKLPICTLCFINAESSTMGFEACMTECLPSAHTHTDGYNIQCLPHNGRGVQAAFHVAAVR